MGTSSCAHDDNFFLLAKNKQIRVGRYQLFFSLDFAFCRATTTNPLLTIMLPGSHKKKKKKQLQLQPQ
jgi:hypothetical protein